MARRRTIHTQDHLWKLKDGRCIEFGSVPHEWDVRKYQGRPHDLIAFDELSEFTAPQYRFLLAGTAPTTRSSAAGSRRPATRLCRPKAAGCSKPGRLGWTRNSPPRLRPERCAGTRPSTAR